MNPRSSILAFFLAHPLFVPYRALAVTFAIIGMDTLCTLSRLSHTVRGKTCSSSPFHLSAQSSPLLFITAEVAKQSTSEPISHVARKKFGKPHEKLRFKPYSAITSQAALHCVFFSFLCTP